MKILLNILLLSLLFVQEHYGQLCGTKAPINYRTEKKVYNVGNSRSTSPILVTIKPTIFRRSNGTGGITITQLKWAINNLREHFVQANIEFAVCGPRIIFDDVLFNTLYADLNDANDFDDPDLVLQDYMTPDAVDIFFVQNMEVAGGASLPVHKNGQANERDWIAIDNDFVATPALMAHEMGHYLGLLHTHESTADRHDADPNVFDANKVELVNGFQCNQRGDNICDTDASPDLSGANLVDANCNYIGTLTDLNGTPYTPDPRNIMSYARGACKSIFSNGQINKMHAHLNSFAFQYGRGYVVGSNCGCPTTSWVFISDANNYLGCNEHVCWVSDITNVQQVEAKQTIKAYNKLTSTSDVIYQAGQTILLEPGFKVELGAKFKTKSQSCTVAPCTTTPVTNGGENGNRMDMSFSQPLVMSNATTLKNSTTLQCYPNPTNGLLNVLFSVETVDNVQLELVDINGRIVIDLKEEKLEIGVHQYQLSTEELVGGVYMLVVRVNGTTQTEKIVIQH